MNDGTGTEKLVASSDLIWRAGMNGKDGTMGRKFMAAPEAPRRQSGVLQENGRKDSTAGLVPPATKNGRLSQVSSTTTYLPHYVEEVICTIPFLVHAKTRCYSACILCCCKSHVGGSPPILANSVL